MYRYLLPAAITLLALALVFSTWVPAHAQSEGYSPTCSLVKASGMGKRVLGIQDWMRVQHASGATDFSVAIDATAGGGFVACAW